MIPHRLRLSNFMCYREEQSLDFSGIHLACLAGENGHGKSALLDAMTWALWGRARAQRDDELIALGETEMWVEFEFGLGGQRYRVWRQRSRKGRGQTDLHFYVCREGPEGDEWQPLDEGGLRERQAQIVRVLRMEYDTFVNSAFLLQGRADSFTVKTAGERKQILADILGLERYDLYEARAKEEAQARKEQAGRVQADIAAIDLELGRRAEYEARLQAAAASATGAAEALRAAEAESTAARQVLQERRSQARQLEDLRGRLARTERDLADLQAQLDAARVGLAHFEALLLQREEIEAGWAQLEQARRADAAWNDRLLQHTQLTERGHQAQLAVEQGRLALDGEYRRLAGRQADLERKMAAGQEQAALLREVEAILERMTEQQARRDAVARELRELGERVAGLKAERERIEAEGRAVAEKAALLRCAAEAACPLCGQPLTLDHRDRMVADLDAARDDLQARYRAAADEVRLLLARKTALEAEDAGLVRELRPRDARQRQAAQAETGVAEAQAAAEEHERLAAQIAELSARLAAGDYARDAQADWARISAALAGIGYDAGAHEAVRGVVSRMAPFDSRYQRQLLPALDGIADARARVASLAAGLARREAEIADDRAAAQELASQVADLPALEAALRQAEAQAERAAATERRARLEEGAALQQLHALDVLAVRRVQRLADLEAVQAELSIYNQLREAFGKKGLQAMIIESVIPEIEVEANRLLGRMSEGRMNLRLETQREKVTGGVAETLDIIISDELGARPYELFSGGEGFRANLALRIAISKLLARRAGAQLQTLVIDEGFGSQDAQGRALVVEAINSIQDDFARVIVITHIEELRDLFPARIDVVKTAAGSRVSIG